VTGVTDCAEVPGVFGSRCAARSIGFFFCVSTNPWAALVLMVFDHVNKCLNAEKLPVIFQLGRIDMPMFGFVLAYNLARPDALAGGVHGRMMYRLTLMGLAASPMVIILNGMYVTANAWWPLNILFMLLLVVL
jgi:mannitol-specific phosphotransferase system IIBC component